MFPKSWKKLDRFLAYIAIFFISVAWLLGVGIVIWIYII